MQAEHVAEKRKGRLELGRLALDVQALRDVKHFVKDYKGHLPPALPPPGIPSLALPFKHPLHACWRYRTPASSLFLIIVKDTC